MVLVSVAKLVARNAGLALRWGGLCLESLAKLFRSCCHVHFLWALLFGLAGKPMVSGIAVPQSSLQGLELLTQMNRNRRIRRA